MTISGFWATSPFERSRIHPVKKGWVDIQKIYIKISVRCVIKKFPKTSVETTCSAWLELLNQFHLHMKRDGPKYPWLVVPQLDRWRRILGRIALRLESLVCNNTITERTNGRIRRFLPLLRLRMSQRNLNARRVTSKQRVIVRVSHNHKSPSIRE
jgi:hypothetical protein